MEPVWLVINFCGKCFGKIFRLITKDPSGRDFVLITVLFRQDLKVLKHKYNKIFRL